MQKQKVAKVQLALAAMAALWLSHPSEAAKKKAKSKPKKAAVTETVPADLPPIPDDETLPGNENSALGEPPADMALQEEPAPAEAAPALPADEREPAQMGPSQGASMTADTPPPAEEYTPGELPPEDAPGESLAEGPEAEPPAESPEAPPAEIPPAIRAAAGQSAVEAPPTEAPPTETVTTEGVAETEANEAPLDTEPLPPTDEKAVAEKRRSEREAREKALQEMAERKEAEEDEKFRNRHRNRGKRLLAEEEGGTLMAESTREYTWQSPRHFGLDLQIAPVQYNALTLGGAGASANKQGTGGRLGFEWMFLQAFGKLSLGVGLHYSQLPAAASVDGEAISVTALGGEATFTYRLDLIQHQILVPFARFGMDGAYAIQNRADGSVFSQGSYRGLIYGGGIELCLFIFEKRTARLLDRNFGINETYFVFEYAKSQASAAGSQPDLSHDEFRFGLRFEI